MSLGGLGKSPIDKSVTLRVGGQASGTRRSSGGAERTLTATELKMQQREKYYRDLNNRNINVVNDNRTVNTPAYNSGSSNAAGWLGAAAASAPAIWGIVNACKGSGSGAKYNVQAGGNAVTGAQGFAGTRGTTSGSHVSRMQSASDPATLRSCIQNAENRKAQLAETVNNPEVQQKYEDNKAKLTDTQNEITTMEDGIRDMKQEVSNKKNHLESDKRKLSSEKQKLQNANEGYKNACANTAKCETAVSNAQTAYENAVSSKVTAEDNVKTLEGKMNDPNLSAEQRSSLQTQLGTAKTRLQEAITNVTKAEQARDKAKTDLETAKQEESKALQTCQSMEGGVKDLADAVKNQQDQVANLEKEQKALDEKLKTAQNKLKDLQQEEKTLQSDIDGFEAKQREYDELDSEIGNQKKRLAEMEKAEEKAGEKAGKGLKNSTYWANQHEQYRDAALARGDKITANMEDGLMKKAQGNANAYSKVIDNSFKNEGLNRMTAGQTISLDGKTYTAVGDGIHFTNSAGQTVDINQMKIEFAKERSWHGGQFFNTQYGNID